MRAADLQALFLRQRAMFARHFPERRVAGARLEIIERACPQPPCAERDYADADGSRGSGHPGVIRVTKRVLRLPRHNILGLIRHELAHLADDHVERSGREQRADDIAADVTGVLIRYDANDLQTTHAAGRWPRPKHLHR
jgi:hypothetical protein